MFRLWREERRGDETKREEQPWLLKRSTNTAPIKLYTLNFCTSPWSHSVFHRNVCDRLEATQAPSHPQHWEPAMNMHIEQIKWQCLSYKGWNPIHLVLLLWDAWFCVSFLAPAPLVCRFHPSSSHSSSYDPTATSQLQPQLQSSCLLCQLSHQHLKHFEGGSCSAEMVLTFIHRGDFHGETAKPSWRVFKSIHYTVSN